MSLAAFRVAVMTVKVDQNHFPLISRMIRLCKLERLNFAGVA